MYQEMSLIQGRMNNSKASKGCKIIVNLNLLFSLIYLIHSVCKVRPFFVTCQHQTVKASSNKASELVILKSMFLPSGGGRCHSILKLIHFDPDLLCAILSRFLSTLQKLCCVTFLNDQANINKSKAYFIAFCQVLHVKF